MKRKPSMHQQAKPILFKYAKQLRRKTTPSEDALWGELFGRRLLNLKFRQQHPIGKYIADFYCHQLRLVIEVDGGYHLAEEQLEKDNFRDAEMKAHQLYVLRLTNEEILEDISKALERIENFVEEIKG